MTKIKSVNAQELINSRGLPSVQVYVELENGIRSKSSVPSGILKGNYDAVDLRDGDRSRLNGMGVLKAIENVNMKIAPNLVNMDVTDQKKIDKLMIEMDGTPNKSTLGANSVLSVSQAVAKAAAKSTGISLYKYLNNFMITKQNSFKIPTPIFNVIEGGKHVANNFSFQEFLIIPGSSKSYKESLEIGLSIYQYLKIILVDKGVNTLVAEEGGFVPPIPTNQEGLSIIKEATDLTKYKLSLDVFLGIDANANSFKIDDTYKLIDRSAAFTIEELTNYYMNFISESSVIYLEDPFGENDINGWKMINAKLSSRSLIVGDDLTYTNPYRLQMAIDNNLLNGIIIKPTQIGTLTETIAVCEMAKFKNLKVIVSGRSSETEDDFIADLAVAVGADYVKFGAPARERIIKYNRLSEIDREIGGI